MGLLQQKRFCLCTCVGTRLCLYISHILSAEELGKLRTSRRSNFCMTIPPNLSRYIAPDATKLCIDLYTSSFTQHPTALVYCLYILPVPNETAWLSSLCVFCCVLWLANIAYKTHPITNPNPPSNPKYLPKWINGTRAIIFFTYQFVFWISRLFSGGCS